MGPEEGIGSILLPITPSMELGGEREGTIIGGAHRGGRGSAAAAVVAALKLTGEYMKFEVTICKVEKQNRKALH